MIDRYLIKVIAALAVFPVAVVLALVAILFPADAFAVPATIEVTPSSISADGSGGLADSFRLHRGCDLGAQTVGPLLADPAQVGETYTFSGDTDNSYNVCAVAVNSAGVGGFANVVTLSFDNVVLPPGDTIIVLACDVDAASGVVADCVQVNSP
tara:strand:+ start:27727 stop:28188 length:462 start_codon:yes stop_codon:yes gene_type:complete